MFHVALSEPPGDERKNTEMSAQKRSSILLLAMLGPRHKLVLADRGKRMRKFVARLNIDHYRDLLAVEPNIEKRKRIEQLLAEEQAELEAAKEKDREQKAR